MFMLVILQQMQLRSSHIYQMDHEMNRELFVSLWFGSCQQKVKDLVCAPAKTEPFPARSVPRSD